MIRTTGVPSLSASTLLLLGLLCCALGSRKAQAQATAADFYVAPNGSDDWSGGLPERNAARTDGPLATLARARDAVRQLREVQPDRDIVVLVRGGTYRLADTVVFSLGDSAPDGHTITYAAYPGETPVFSSGLPILGWEPLTETPSGLPEAAKDNVWVADVSSYRDLRLRNAPTATDEDRGWGFLTLYQGDRRLPRARGEGFSPTESTPNRRGPDQEILHFPDGAIRNWPGLRDAEVVIIPCSFWVANILPIASVDEEAGVARTAVPGTYSLGKNGMTDRDSAWVENVLAVLDQPGEWVLDSEGARLYLWPEGDAPGDDIVAPLLTELMRVEGQIDYDGPQDTPVRGLVFRGLTFTHGDRLPWHGNTGWGLQHDWEMSDRPTALVRLRGAEGCAVEDCHFLNSGHTAVRLDLHCQSNRVVGNHIEHVGGVGVLLAGYGPGTKDVNRDNEVANNYIHDIGEIYWGSAGIFAWQSGENRIAHNHIHHCPYTGIVVSGRISWDPNGVGECSRTVRWDEIEAALGERPGRLPWHERERFLHGRNNLVERNDIHNVMEVLGDGNCIYISGTGTGNHVKRNYCHDCTGKYMNAVIRCDDDQHGTIIEGNLMHRTEGHAEGVISKGDNDIINNVIADLRQTHQHRGYIVFPYGSLEGSAIQRNVIYSCRKGQSIYFEGQGRGGGPAPRLRDADADHNLYWCTDDPDWGKRHLEEEQQYGIELSSICAEPLFVDADRGDFRFQPGSPAATLDIEPFVGVADIGLESPYRERLVGRVIGTAISPHGGQLRRPVQVMIESDAPDAEIRYTLDGTEPTRQSLLYTQPLTLTDAATVRARAFADGATDLVGAVARFSGPPEPILQDFEALAVGSRTPGAETQEENETMTARVSDEQAASGRHSLKFVDGPGQEQPFNPHVFYRTNFDYGRAVGGFDLRIDSWTSFYYQWRDYTRGFVRGPTVRVLPGGQLVHGDQELMRVPVDQWVRYEVVCGLGDDATGTFDLKVFLPGEGEPRAFEGLDCEEGFRRLDWVGFVSPGTETTIFYVDDIEVRLLPEDE